MVELQSSFMHAAIHLGPGVVDYGLCVQFIFVVMQRCAMRGWSMTLLPILLAVSAASARRQAMATVVQISEFRFSASETGLQD